MGGRHQPEAGADSADALRGIDSGPEEGGATRPGSPPAPGSTAEEGLLPPGVQPTTLSAYWTVVAAGDLPMEDRGLAYAVLHQVQLRIRRRLGIGQRGRTIQNELVSHMAANELRAMGPLVLKSTAFDVAWPANDPENWEDATVQDHLAAIAADPVAHVWIRRVPYHLEIDTAALGADVHAGLHDALVLWREFADKGWRTEGGKRLSLDVRPPKGNK